MPTIKTLKPVAISTKAHHLLATLLSENPFLKEIFTQTNSQAQAKFRLKKDMLSRLKARPHANAYYQGEDAGEHIFKRLDFKDLALIRILDYLDHAGRRISDANLGGETVESDPFDLLYHAAQQGTGGAEPDFFSDMIYLFRQLQGRLQPTPVSKEKIAGWMARHPSGLDERIIKIRRTNKSRILKVIIDKISQGRIRSEQYHFPSGMTDAQKMALARRWWKSHQFHIRFAAQTPGAVNEMLGFSLDAPTMDILERAHHKGIPIFANPYYLSLLDTKTNPVATGADLAIRQYILYTRDLVNEFGRIQAWEKEDTVVPGEPNAAGWIIPDINLHRRYPNVAIIIPKTLGRACGGLCASCQRMYGFQNGSLNFDHDRLRAQGSWKDHLDRLMAYFETDSQLRDVLITGGDALMSSDRILHEILERVYQMARRKQAANDRRKSGEKLAPILRVRLGTRLPVYLPMRIQPGLVRILANFKKKAAKVGVRQFIFQTHFESPMEITPETLRSIRLLSGAGWLVVNQHVFTSSASRRGHGAKLRQVMNDIGILPYYFFSVKGFQENRDSFTPNARLVQEIMEEKKVGILQKRFRKMIRKMASNPEQIMDSLPRLRQDTKLPFLATDRNVMNLPGVGKSLTFRTIGITHDGRRILEFDHDGTRQHSPIIEKMGKMTIVESKSMADYMRQLEDMGEDLSEYNATWGYAMYETECRMPVFEYPSLPYELTGIVTNLDIGR